MTAADCITRESKNASEEEGQELLKENMALNYTRCCGGVVIDCLWLQSMIACTKEGKDGTGRASPRPPNNSWRFIFAGSVRLHIIAYRLPPPCMANGFGIANIKWSACPHPCGVRGQESCQGALTRSGCWAAGRITGISRKSSVQRGQNACHSAALRS